MPTNPDTTRDHDEDDDKPAKGPRDYATRIAEVDDKIATLQRERLRLVHLDVAEQCHAVPHLKYLGRIIRAYWRGGQGDAATSSVDTAREMLASFHRKATGPESLPAAGSPELHDALAPKPGTAERIADRLGVRPLTEAEKDAADREAECRHGTAGAFEDPRLCSACVGEANP